MPFYSGDSNAGLTAGQAYNIHLELDMPESEVNHNAGTFMISALYYDKVSTIIDVLSTIDCICMTTRNSGVVSSMSMMRQLSFQYLTNQVHNTSPIRHRPYK